MIVISLGIICVLVYSLLTTFVLTLIHMYDLDNDITRSNFEMTKLFLFWYIIGPYNFIRFIMRWSFNIIGWLIIWK